MHTYIHIHIHICTLHVPLYSMVVEHTADWDKIVSDTTKAVGLLEDARRPGGPRLKPRGRGGVGGKRIQILC